MANKVKTERKQTFHKSSTVAHQGKNKLANFAMDGMTKPRKRITDGSKKAQP